MFKETCEIHNVILEDTEDKKKVNIVQTAS